MTQIIAVLNHKGGVGKSTTAVSLAAALQLSKKNVLAIDMDGQANLTEALGLSIEEEQTVYGAMCGQYTLPLVKLHNGITVSPSCLDLSAAELELISEPGRELILKGLITKAIAKEHFDYIIIDCPPSLGRARRGPGRSAGSASRRRLRPVSPARVAVAGRNALPGR